MTWLDDIGAGVRLLWTLPALLRTPLSPPEAQAILRRRLERRDQGFLDLARATIFGAAPGAARVMELFWRDAGVLRVERQAPLVTATGKIQHLHQHRMPTGR